MKKFRVPSLSMMMDSLDRCTAAPADGDYDAHVIRGMHAVYDYMIGVFGANGFEVEQADE